MVRNSAMNKYLLLIGIIGLLALLGIYSNDLQLKNAENLFISKKGTSSLEQFESNFSKEKLLILLPSIEDFIDRSKINLICNNSCSIENAKNNKKSLFPLVDNSNFQPPIIISSENPDLLKSIVHFVVTNYPKTLLAGPAYINYYLDKDSETIGKKIFPLFFVAICILIIILLKSFKNAAILILPTIFAALASQAIIKYFFITSNIIITIIPLLVSILTLTTILHIVFQLKETPILTKAIVKKFRPICFMAISTSIGFSSLGFAPLKLISTFGWLVSILLLTFMALILFTLYQIKGNKFEINYINWPKRLIKIPYLTKSTVILICILIVGFPFYFSRIPIEKDASNYFDPKLKIKEKLTSINHLLGGTPILDIVLPLDQFGKNGHSIFGEIFEIEEEFSSKLKVNILSANRITQLVNNIYSGTNNLPTNDNAYYILFSKAPNTLQQLYSIDNYYRLSILGTHISGDAYANLVKIISSLLSKHQLTYEFSGLYYWLMDAQSEIINTLIVSFLTTISIISIIVLVIYRKFKYFLIFLFVNISPLILILYLMPILGISINIATVMSFSISIGLMVDSTFHLFHEKICGFTLSECHQRTVLPIIYSNLILGILFLFFIFIPFLPIRQFGLTMSLATFIGLIFDVLILPKLIDLN